MKMTVTSFTWRKRAVTAAALALAGMLAASPVMRAGDSDEQNQKTNKKAPQAQPDNGASSPIPLTDSQAVDTAVGEMLAYWQIGDVQSMRKYYSDDVVVVSAAWEPPVVGWENYSRLYQASYARTTGPRLERTKTVSKVLGDTAWVTYQWQFTGQMGGTPVNALGHTTLVLEKRAGNWVIVLNHTSEVPSDLQPAAVPASAVSPQLAPAGAASTAQK